MGHLHAVEVAAALALGDAAVVGEGHVPAVDHILNQGGPIVCRRRQAGIAAGEGWETRSAKQYFSAVLPPPLHCYSGLWQPGSSRELQGSAVQRSAAQRHFAERRTRYITPHVSEAQPVWVIQLGQGVDAAGVGRCGRLMHVADGAQGAEEVGHVKAQGREAQGLPLGAGCWMQDGRVAGAPASCGSSCATASTAAART
jgi:hypothetical protein